MDSAPVGPLGTSLLIDLALLGLFAVQHSVMARPAFKRWWTRIIPQPAERSTYVLASSFALTKRALSAVSGQCRLMTSASAKSSSIDRQAKPA